jgi:hypothetical protein
LVGFFVLVGFEPNTGCKHRQIYSETTGMKTRSQRMDMKIEGLMTRKFVKSMGLVSLTVFALIGFVLPPQSANAHWGNAGSDACIFCHNNSQQKNYTDYLSNAQISTAAIFVGVDGVDETADDLTITVAEGTSFEIDWYYTNVSGKDAGMPLISLPAGAAGWTIAKGSTGTAPSAWGANWKSQWDQGHTSGTDTYASFANKPEFYAIERINSSWTGGNGTYDDDATAGDLDATAQAMGSDALIGVPVGAAAGSPYTMTIHGIGHEGNTKNHIMATLTINVTGGSTTAPTLSAPTATSIGSTTATLGATVDTDGGDPTVSQYGTCWDTATAPTVNCSTLGATTPPTTINTDARTGLPAQTQVYYAGYATNSTGTAYTTDGSFYTEPDTPASGVNITCVGSNSMTVNWTRGSGSEVIVLVKATTAVDSAPVDGTYTTYTANAAFGSGTQIGAGNYVVYKGTGTSVPVTALLPSTDYHVAVYELAGAVDTLGDAQGTNYLQTSAPTATDTTSIGTTAPTLSAPTATSIGSTTATLGATVDTDGGDPPVTQHGTCWDTAAAPTVNCSLLGATTPPTTFSNDARTGLPAQTQVYYAGYATNSTGTDYTTDGSFYTEPATQASGVNFTTVNTNDMTINWTRGSGNEVIVLVKQGSAVDSDPVDGTYTDYTADPIFGSGTQLGTGNHVVYIGNGTSVTVTNLINTTTYHVAVYEISGAANTAGDDLGSNYLLTPATGSQLTATPPNQNPNVPSNPSFNQFKSDTTTLIEQGTYTDEGTLVFKATLSDNDGDPVQLQVEVQPVGTAFTGTANCGPGTAVSSGSLATVTCSGISDGEYKWQAQAIDDQAATGNWLEY